MGYCSISNIQEKSKKKLCSCYDRSSSEASQSVQSLSPVLRIEVEADDAVAVEDAKHNGDVLSLETSQEKEIAFDQ